MKKLLLLLSLCAFSLQAEVVDKATGASFPEQVQFDGYTLDATGVATRKKFFVKVYSVASYLQEGAEGSERFANPKYTKQLSLRWQRGVGADKVRSGYADALKGAEQAEQFLSFFAQGVKEGDLHEYRWIPQGKIQVWINGEKKGEIDNVSFAKKLWSIWFGPKSVVDKSKLTG